MFSFGFGVDEKMKGKRFKVLITGKQLGEILIANRDKNRLSFIVHTNPEIQKITKDKIQNLYFEGVVLQ